MKQHKFKLTALLLGVLFMVAACSGSGGGDGPIGTGLGGTAAEGNPIINQTITLKDSVGTRLETTTDEHGTFKFDDVSKLIPPFLLSTTTANGRRLFSVAANPNLSNGAKNTVNIHPFTDVITRNWFSSRKRNIESEFDANGGFVTPTPQDFELQIMALISAINNLLALAYTDTAFDVPSQFDFISSSFDANSTGFDKLLDNISMKLDGNLITIRLKNPDTGFIATIILNFDMSQNLAAADDQAPSTPSGLLALAASTSSVLTVWNSSQDNIGVAGYHVYRDGQLVATTPYPMYSDTGLSGSNPICYEVEAVDGTGNTSAKAKEVCVTLPTTPDTTPPSSAGGLTTTATSNHVIALTWMPSSDNDVIGYAIFRGPSGDISTKIATSVASSFEDFGLTPSVEYCYKVVAIDAAGNPAADSNISCATSPSTKPGVIPNAPVISGSTPTNDTTPTWSWVTGGNGNGTFRYQLDNSDFTTGATQTTDTTFTPGAALTEGSHVLYVQERNDAGMWSAAGTYAIVIDITPPGVTATPTGSTYTSTQLVTLTCADNVSTPCSIYYTLDGTNPTTSSTLYTSAINIDASSTLNFMAVDSAGNSSATVTENYAINKPVTSTLSVISNDSTGNISSNIAGINCGATCSSSFDTGSQITLTASHPGGLLPIWTGCTTSTADQCTVQLNDNHTVYVSFVAQVNESEPNDTYNVGQAISGASIISGFFNTTTDSDYYTITVSQRGTFYATISHSSVKSLLYLYDSTNTLVTSSGGCCGALSQTLTQSLSAGTYYLQVKPYSAADLVEPYKLTLSGTVLGTQSPDLNEENDSFATATAISASSDGQPVHVQGYLDTINDDDYFTFTVAKRSTLQVSIAHPTAKSQMMLYDSQYAQLTYSGGCCGATTHTLTWSLDAGTYYIKVHSYSAYDLSTPYQLTFSGTAFGVPSPDVNEENDSFATATPVATTGGPIHVQGYLDTVIDDDYYSFTVAKRSTLQVTIAHPTAKSQMMLYDSQYAQLTYSGGCCGATTHTLTWSLDAGTYYIKVHSYSAYDLSTPYQLTFSGTAFGVPSPDVNEENDSFATATPVATTGGPIHVQGYLDTVIDDDYYTFTVSKRSTLQVSIAHPTAMSQMMLYDSQYAQLTYSGGCCGATTHTLTWSLDAGTYYIKVHSYNAYDLSTPYQLTFSGTAFGVPSPDVNEENDSFATATPVATTGGPLHVQGYLDTVIDDDYFTFTVDKRSTVIVSIAHPTAKTQMMLYDSQYTQLTYSGGCCGATTHTLTWSLDAGTYYIKVHSYSAYDLSTPYQLTFSGTAFGVASPDLNEENDSFATATSITDNAGYVGYFDTINDEDYFVINVTSAGLLQATVTHPSVANFITLYDASKSLVASSGGCCGLTTQTLSYSVSVGTYYLMVRSNSVYDLSTSYSLSLAPIQ